MNNPFDYIPHPDCDRAFSALCRRLEQLSASGSDDDKEFCRQLERGCMIGVLIATDANLSRHTLYAFSGQIGAGGFYYPGFVGPVFDYLSPESYFKQEEAKISQLTRDIDAFEHGSLLTAISEYNAVNEKEMEAVVNFREECRKSKQQRDFLRKDSTLSQAEQEALIRKSQFEKAELRRLKQRAVARVAPLKEKVDTLKARLQKMKDQRRASSEALQDWLFTNFRVVNAEGNYKSLKDIFLDTTQGIPPSGAGECSGPKLLQAAYLQGLHPEAIAEYWYGSAKGEDMRIHGEAYPACRGRCLPVLRWMLKGLELTPPLDTELTREVKTSPRIIYENEWFCVVEKPSGILSVPGKGTRESVQAWLEKRYKEKDVKLVHRLDQDTSGLLIAAFGHDSYKLLQSMFARREIKKTYEAILDGDYKKAGLPEAGVISLPLSPDLLDRPRQRVDIASGKEAVSDYEFVGTGEGVSRIRLYPRTGRTHQLRMHTASPLGLNLPILGDRLYGKRKHDPLSCLHLHAAKIEFHFTPSGEDYIFESPVPF